MVIMKKKRYSKSKIPVSLPISPTPILTFYKKLLSSFFTFIIDIFIDNSIFLNDTYNIEYSLLYNPTRRVRVSWNGCILGLADRVVTWSRDPHFSLIGFPAHRPLFAICTWPFLASNAWIHEFSKVASEPRVLIANRFSSENCLQVTAPFFFERI